MMKLKEKIKEQLKQDPSNVILMNKLAIVYMEDNEIEKAFQVFEKAAKQYPTIQTLNNLAYFYLYEGESLGDDRYISKAINLLKQTIELNPKHHFPYSLLGEVYLQVGRFSEAERILSKAVNFQPTHVNQNNLGVTFFHLEQYEEAAIWFLRAYTYHGNRMKTYLN